MKRILVVLLLCSCAMFAQQDKNSIELGTVGDTSIKRTGPGVVIITNGPDDKTPSGTFKAAQYCLGSSCITDWPSAIATIAGLQAALDAKAPLSQPYDVGVFIPTLTAGKANVNQLIPRAWTLPSGLTGSLCGIKTDGTNPSGSIVVSLKKSTTEFGTATVATDGTCALASSSGASFNGTTEYYSIVMPADVKGAAGLSITLAGTR